MILDCYFDGANKADSTRHDKLTLACVAGTPQQWKKLEKQWAKTLSRAGASYIHVTDMVALEGDFDKAKGWTRKRADALLLKCVKIAHKHFAKPGNSRRAVQDGIFPITTTIILKEFVRARRDNAKVPKDANEICVTQVLHECLLWGRERNPRVEHFNLYFDQNEPFRGHIWDRQHKKASLREYPETRKIKEIAEADMRLAPALQVADLLAWSIAHLEAERKFEWHSEMLKHPTKDSVGDYERLMKPNTAIVDQVAAWNLPKRKLHP